MTQAWLCGWAFAPTRNDSFVSTLACASACICHCAAQYLLLVLAASCLLVTFAHCTFANNPLFSQQALGGYEDDTWTIPVLQVKPVLYLGALVCHSVPALLGPMQWLSWKVQLDESDDEDDKKDVEDEGERKLRSEGSNLGEKNIVCGLWLILAQTHTDKN